VKRILLVMSVAALMVAMIVATAMPAFAAPNPGSAAGECGPLGQYFNVFTPNPKQQFEIAPGTLVGAFCAPGQLE
jgi:hypothetical protein